MLAITDENYTKEIIEHKGLSVLDCWAEWCGPCRMFGPTFEAAAKDLPEVKFAKCDVDNAQDVPASLGIRSIPTIVFFKDGKEVGRFSGVLGKEEFIKKVKEYQ
ncbi:MAG: thioredoxin [Candidatus Woesearchaeota archaeon]